MLLRSHSDFATSQQAAVAPAGDLEGPASEGDAHYQIGEAADRAGVTQRTVRFYEERGLLRGLKRLEGGFRLDCDHDIERVELIRRLKSLFNLSLAEIGEMFEAEALLAQVTSNIRPGRGLRALKGSLGQVRDEFTLQSKIVEDKKEQLREIEASEGQPVIPD